MLHLFSLLIVCFFGRITEIPQGISSLKKLRVLNLSYNQISALPPDLNELMSLIELDVSHNQLALIAEVAGNKRNIHF